jgi:AraC family transcriptional regulator
MTDAKPLVLNTTQRDENFEIFPCLPLLSSQKLGWDGIYVQYDQQPAWEMPEHSPTHHTVVVHHYKQASKTERVLDGRSQTAQISDGDIFLVPAKVSHKFSWETEIHYSSLMFDTTHISAIAHEFVDSDRVELIPHFAMRDPLIYQICLALLSELKSEGLGTRLYAESMATALWAHLLKNYSTHRLQESAHSLAKRQLQPAIDFINDNLDQDLKLAEIAAVVNMSQFYFARMFKQLMGIAPHQYVVGRRMERSQQLLTKSQLSVAEVALRVGFSNQSHFTAQFRKATGTTPKGYRNSL